MGKARRESPKEAFQNLRRCFDELKDKHGDPWCWHEYLQEQPELDDDEDLGDDPVNPRYTEKVVMDRLKTHLLTAVSALNECAQAADTCYYHMCCTPAELKPCVTVLGTSGDVDEDMLAGGATPAQIMAALQKKLDDCHHKIADLEDEIRELKERLDDTRAESKDRWQRWQRTAMQSEEAMTRLSDMAETLRQANERNAQLEEGYRDLYKRFIRASRIMIYKGRQQLRDAVFKCNRKENLFYAFHGFIQTLQSEKEERIRREHEAQRDRVEFALRNEVRHLMWETDKSTASTERLVLDVGRLKQDRRALACRLMYKNRPHEALEYCLWVWELWQPIREAIRLEKYLEREQAMKDAVVSQLVQTSTQLPPLANRIDTLTEDLVAEKIAHDISKRELTAMASKKLSVLVEKLRDHRDREMAVLARLHEVDVADKIERIAVLEREIAENKHIHALKGMVIDLETNLRRALDMRKQRAFIVPQSSETAAHKCPQCAKESLFANWRGTQPDAPSAFDSDMSTQSGGPSGLRASASLGSLQAKGVSPRFEGLAPSKMSALPPPNLEKHGRYSALWR